jgi:hypothetical protein
MVLEDLVNVILEEGEDESSCDSCSI